MRSVTVNSLIRKEWKEANVRRTAWYNLVTFTKAAYTPALADCQVILQSKLHLIMAKSAYSGLFFPKHPFWLAHRGVYRRVCSPPFPLHGTSAHGTSQPAVVLLSILNVPENWPVVCPHVRHRPEVPCPTTVPQSVSSSLRGTPGPPCPKDFFAVCTRFRGGFFLETTNTEKSHVLFLVFPWAGIDYFRAPFPAELCRRRIKRTFFESGRACLFRTFSAPVPILGPPPWQFSIAGSFDFVTF